MPTRRDFLKLLLASAVAEAVDVEQLLWVPKPIIMVPAITYEPHPFVAFDQFCEVMKMVYLPAVRQQLNQQSLLMRLLEE